MLERRTFDRELENLTGRRIPRARVGDVVGERILALLWEAIEDDDVPTMADRLRRLEAVLDAVSDYDAGALLARLLPGGDLFSNFEYRLKTITRNRLRDKLRARAKVRPAPVVPVPPAPRLPVPRPPGVAQPDPPIPILPPLPPLQPRWWALVGQYNWELKRHRVLKKGYFNVYLQGEFETTFSANVSGNELATFKVKWIRGKGPGGELDTQFKDWFKPELKIERDSGQWQISLKKEFAVLGGAITFEPHLKLSPEFVDVQVAFPKFTLRKTLFGQAVAIEVKPKIHIIIEFDLAQYLKDQVKRHIPDVIDWFLRQFGRRFVGSLLKELALMLLGAEIVYLLLRPAPTAPPAAPPDDIAGKNQVLALVANTTSNLARIQKWADMHRHGFAKAYGDYARELTSSNWRAMRQQLQTASVRQFIALPAPTAPVSQWETWAAGKKAVEIVSLPYASDDFVQRFRWYEIALMFIVAAWILRRIGKAEAHIALQTVLQQTSFAGGAAAIQRVNKVIAQHNFRFVDEDGNTRFKDGLKHQDAVVALIKGNGLSAQQIGDRLQELGLSTLPHL